MSHGSDDSSVPNLTPLLDVVLQLLMFFMMCVNFVSDAIAKDIDLPVSQMAQSLVHTKAKSVLFLNIDKQGGVDAPGMSTTLSTPGAIRFYLRQQFDDDERAEVGRGAKRTVVIRADQNTDYDKIYLVLSICKEVGYKKLQLRVMLTNK
jgi:biopolymer transport protein ExbD